MTGLLSMRAGKPWGAPRVALDRGGRRAGEFTCELVVVAEVAQTLVLLQLDVVEVVMHPA